MYTIRDGCVCLNVHVKGWIDPYTDQYTCTCILSTLCLLSNQATAFLSYMHVPCVCNAHSGHSQIIYMYCVDASIILQVHQRVT